MAKEAMNRNDRKELSKLQRLGMKGTAALAAVAFGLTGCGDKVEAIPEGQNTVPPTPEQTTSAPATPGKTETTVSPTSGPSTTESTIHPTPTQTEEAPGDSVEVPPFRNWNIPSDTVDRLESAESDLEKWDILKEIIENNNEPGVYQKDVITDTLQVKGISIEELFNRTRVELATIADIGQDPNATGGDVIAETWANLAIMDDDNRSKFMGTMVGTREILSSEDREAISYTLEDRLVSPRYHLEPEILHSSNRITIFHDRQTEQDYIGMTFTGIYVVPARYNSGHVITMTIVVDQENNSTKILRQYSESMPGGWEISYNPGDAPMKVSDIPAVKDRIGKNQQ